MRPHVEDRLAGLRMRVCVSVLQLDRSIAEEHAAVFDSPVEQIHVAEKVVHERIRGMVIDSSAEPICSICPWFITTIRLASSSASS